MIDENAAHHLRRETIELGAVLPWHLCLPHEPQVRLVHECGWLQRVVATLAPQVARRLTPEFPMHEREQRLASLHIAAAPRLQQRGDAVQNLPPAGLATRQGLARII